MQAFDCTSLLHVLQTEELLVKRRALLEKKIAQELDKAKTYTKAQNKRGKQPGTRQKMHLLMTSWGWCKGNATINTALACKLLESQNPLCMGTMAVSLELIHQAHISCLQLECSQ